MELISTHVCMRKDLGVHGNLFGGILLAWVDEAAASYACIKADSDRMVTLKISELMFKKPIREGELIKIYGEVTRMGTSSITLNLVIKNHDPKTGKEEVTTSTEIVFVKIDENGKPTKIKKDEN
jgi:acyl-CoA thioesterase YciA